MVVSELDRIARAARLAMEEVVAATHAADSALVAVEVVGAAADAAGGRKCHNTCMCISRIYMRETGRQVKIRLRIEDWIGQEHEHELPAYPAAVTVEDLLRDALVVV